MRRCRTADQSGPGEQISVRRAVPGDEEAMANAAIAAWREGFRGIVPPEIDPADAWRPEHISERLGDPAYDERSILVAEIGDELVGLVVSGPSRDRGRGAGEGEVMALYVHPDHWRRGVGRALVDRAVAGIAAAGNTEVIVWTLAESPRNIAFYESLGFALDGGAQRRRSFADTLEVRLRTSLSSRGSDM